MAARRKPARRRTKAYREFVSEAEEILERMRDDLSDLADRRGDGRDVDPELVNRLFRSAHSLKGLSGMFGLDGVSELSHHLEDVLDGLRMGRTALDEGALSLLDESVTLVAHTLEKLEEGADAGLDDQAAELIARIDAWTRAPGAAAGSASDLDLDPAMLRALTEYEEHRLRENVQRGRRIHIVESSFDILSFEEGLAELTAAVREVGEVLSTLPSPGESPESQIRFSLLVASELDPESLASRLELAPEAVRSATPGGGRAAERGAQRAEGRGGRGRDAPGGEPRRGGGRRGRRRGGPGPRPRERRRARLAEVDQRDRARRHPQARRADEPGRRAGDPPRLDRQAGAPAARRPGDGARGRGAGEAPQGPRAQAPGAPGGRARGAHGPAAPGVREAVAGRAPAAARHGQGGAARDPRRRHRARQADRRGARRPADARGTQRLRPRDRGARRARRRRASPARAASGWRPISAATTS